MLRINLASSGESISDETSNSRWFVLDLLVLAIVAAAGYYGIQYHIGIAKDKIEIIESETKSISDSIVKLKHAEDRFNSLEVDIRSLANKVKAIQSITTSVFERYKIMIVLEHLQVLQPMGVWYNSLKIFNNNIAIAASAFNNILVAEFLTSLESTKTQEVDPVDLRTYIYFEQSNLVSTVSVTREEGGEDNLSHHVNFSVNITFGSQSYEQVRDENSKELALNDAR